MHVVSISTGDSSAGETAADAGCGCSGGLSRDFPEGDHDNSGSGSSDGGSSAAPHGTTAEDAEGMAAGSETAGERDDMVLVKAGEFRFGTDTPFIVPVWTGAVEVVPSLYLVFIA